MKTKLSRNRMLSILMAIMIALAFMPAAASHFGERAEAKSILMDSSITLDKEYVSEYYGEDYSIETASDNDAVKSAESEDTSIARVYKVRNYGESEYAYKVFPEKAGSTRIKVDTEKGKTGYLSVKIKSNYFSAKLGQCTRIITTQNPEYGMIEAGKIANDNCIVFYGEKTVKAFSCPGADVEFTFDGKTYRAGSKDIEEGAAFNETSYSSDSVKYVGDFKNLPKVKIGTKCSIKAAWKGLTVQYKSKVTSGTVIFAETLKNKASSIKLKGCRAHKGDKIQIRAGSKKYSKKIKKDALQPVYKIKLKKRLKKGQKVSIKVINEYGQTLCSASEKVR